MSEKLIDYNALYYQSQTLAMEVEGMNDESLIEECGHIMTSRLHSPQMDKIMSSFFKKGELTLEQRKAAIAFYILAYGDFIWES
jgi:hypothetical protein